MNGVTKFVIGGVATSLMAMAAHSATGNSFIDSLQGKADAAVSAAGVPGVSAAMVRKPLLNRNVVLSGAASEADRSRVMEAVRAIPGIGSVTWATDAASAPATPAPVAVPEAPATPEAVSNCQGDVDAAITGQEVHFDSGQATIKVESGALLDALAAALKTCSGVKVEVAGHTDAQGNDAANMALSEQRAASVAAALTERGVPSDRMVTRGYGETMPKVPGDSAEAWAQNRRIEFKVASTAAGSEG